MLCQESSESTLPRISPFGHQLRLKNMRIDSATAMRIPSSTPKKITPSVAVSMSTNDDFRIRKNFAAAVTSIRDRAAAMTIAASAEFGRFASRSGSRTSITTTSAAPTRPVTWLLAPLFSATAVREPLVEIGNPWNSPANALAAPIPIISWLAFTSSPRRAAKLVEVAIVSASETSVIPTAAASSAPTSPRSTEGI